MARARSLSRLESFVLDQIAEAGSEEVTTLLNAIDDRRARETALGPFATALRNLCRLGLVQLVDASAAGSPAYDPARAAALLDLDAWLRWDPAYGAWTARHGEQVTVARTDLPAG